MNNKYIKLIIILLFLEHVFFINIYNLAFQSKKKNIQKFKHINFTDIMSTEEEFIKIKNYVDYVFNGTLIDKENNFFSSDKPKISVIITVYNGEPFIKTSLISIQNQDFKDIEIIMIDDCSLDNSVQLIKELKAKDPRIKLYQNKINRGMLYTKTKGILLAKGKYILLLDEDDIYIQRDAFSTLYLEAEKYNLDILNFRKIFSNHNLSDIKYIKDKIEPNIIFQPKLGQMMFNHTDSGEIIQLGGTTHTYFIKRNIFIKVIEKIGKKYLDEKMNFHDDYMMFFLLTRNAYNLKKINKIFHMVIFGWNMTDKKIELRFKEKYKNRNIQRCNAVLNFIEFILYKTEDTLYDKQIAFYSFNKWLLQDECRNFNATYKKALNISNQYINNKYIQENDKIKIKMFSNEIRINF